MVKPCIICWRLSSPQKGPSGVASSKKARETLKKFYQLLGRSLADRRNDKLGKEEDGRMFENLIKAGMWTCEECSKTMESYCELFIQVKTIELQLNWKLDTLEKMMCGDNKVPINQEGLGGGGGVTSLRRKKADLLLDFRMDLVKKCRRKLGAAFPRLALHKYQAPGEGSMSVGDFLPVEVQMETPIVPLVKSEPEWEPPVEDFELLGEGGWLETDMNGDPDWTIEMEVTVSDAEDDDPGNGQLPNPGNGNDVGEEPVEVIPNSELGTFKCGRCQREFSAQNDCRRHYKEVHLRIKSYQCSTCNLTFSRNYHLTRHRQNVHGEAKRIGQGNKLVKSKPKLSPETQIVVEEPEQPEESRNENENDLFDDGSNYLADPDLDMDNQEESEKQTEVEGEGDHERIQMNAVEVPPEVVGKLISESENELKPLQITQNSKNGKFKCPHLTCSKEFTTRKDCRRHYQQVHLKIRTFQCPTCDQTFARKDHLARHHQQVHSEKLEEKKSVKHLCSICREGFSRMDQLRQHLREVHSATIVNEKRPPPTSTSTESTVSDASSFKFACPICFKKFATRHQLGRHRKMVTCKPGRFLQTGIRKHPCPHCDMVLSRSYHLNRHIIRIHKLALPEPDPAAGIVEETDLIVTSSGSTKGVGSNNSAFNPDTMRYRCGRCQKEFKTTWNLQDHQRLVHLNILHKCDLCPKQFRHRKSYRKHRQAVHQMIRHACPKCDKKFIVKSSLLRHQQVGDCSTGVRKPTARVTCPICQRSFNHAGDMKTHIKYVHEKIRDFLCPQCGKGFFNEPGLKRHVMAVHEKLRDHLCDLCGRGFSDDSHLKRHRRVVHPVGEGISSHPKKKRRQRDQPVEMEEVAEVKDEQGPSGEDAVSYFITL